MTYAFDEDQLALQDAVRTYLSRAYDWESRSALIAAEAGWSPEVWRGFAEELGLLALCFGAEHGGMDGSALDRLAVMQALGEALVVEPFAETAILAGSLLRGSPAHAAAERIAAIIAGDAVLAVGIDLSERGGAAGDADTNAERTASGYLLRGCKAVVVGAPWATDLVIGARLASDSGKRALFLVPADAPGVHLRDLRTLDGRRAAEVRLDDVALAEHALIAADAEPLVRRAADEAMAALCGEAVGVLSALLADTVAYLRDRRQFGRFLAEFQGLQHRVADMRVQVELATACAFMATAALEDAAVRRTPRVAAAMVTVGKACRMVSQSAVQLHGGMGMTNELRVGHLFRRAMVIERQFGTINEHLLRMGAAADQPAT